MAYSITDLMEKGPPRPLAAPGLVIRHSTAKTSWVIFSVPPLLLQEPLPFSMMLLTQIKSILNVYYVCTPCVSVPFIATS